VDGEGEERGDEGEVKKHVGVRGVGFVRRGVEEGR
jgi:hypothetical protein